MDNHLVPGCSVYHSDVTSKYRVVIVTFTSYPVHPITEQDDPSRMTSYTSWQTQLDVKKARDLAKMLLEAAEILDPTPGEAVIRRTIPVADTVVDVSATDIPF